MSTAAVSTVSGDDLYHIQSANLSNTWVGMLPGLTVLQGNGAVGYDNAQWLIRGVNSYGSGAWNSAKIFVDGFEVNSEYLKSEAFAKDNMVLVLPPDSEFCNTKHLKLSDLKNCNFLLPDGKKGFPSAIFCVILFGGFTRASLRCA